jgi:AcrR family transcriptional regulator
MLATIQETIVNQDFAKDQPTVSELRRERERSEMVERIMDVAREMFVRDGYEAVTLRKIALAIEYSPGTIYQYFKDKQALVLAIMRKDSQDLRLHLLECLAMDNPIEQMLEMARRYAAWGIAHPNHYLLMLVPPPTWVEQDNDWEKQDTPLEQEVLSVLNILVTQAIEQNLLKSKYSEASLVAATLWAGIHGAVLLEITMRPKERALLGGKDTSFEARFATLREVFLDGFLK